GLEAGVPSTNGVTYTLVVENGGVPAKSLAAEDIAVSLVIPADTKVVSATGVGYQKVQHDEKAKADVAVWKISKLPAKAPQTFTITLSKAPTDQLKGSLRWATPSMKDPEANVVNIASARPGGGRAAGAGAPESTRRSNAYETRFHAWSFTGAFACGRMGAKRRARRRRQHYDHPYAAR